MKRLRSVRSLPATLSVALAAGFALGAGCSDHPGAAGPSPDGATSSGGNDAAAGAGGNTESHPVDASSGPGDALVAPDGGLDANDAPATDTTGGPDGPASGQPGRLETWRVEAEGTTPLVLGIWDTREQVHCQFVPDENGQLRCLPEVARYLSGGSNIYGDSKCQQEVSIVQQDEEKQPLDRPWSRAMSRMGCDALRYQVLRPVPAGSQLYSTSTGACKPINISDFLSPTVPQLPLVADPPERWELATESGGVKLSDRLHIAEDVTSDGARFANHVVDDRWGTICTMTFGVDDGSVVCHPPSFMNATSMFTDSTCMTTVYPVPACQSLAFIGDGRRSSFAFGAPYSGTVYQVGKAGCLMAGTVASSTAEDGMRYYLQGAPLDADVNAPVTEAIAPGTGRLRVRGFVGQDGAVVPVPRDLLYSTSRPFQDTVTNDYCYPAWTPGGQVRCVPEPAVSATFFTDSGCTNLAFLCNDDTGCEKQQIVLATTDSHGRTIATAAYSASTRAPDGTVNIYLGTPGACQLEGSTNAPVYRPTTPLAWDTFPVLQEVHPFPAASP